MDDSGRGEDDVELDGSRHVRGIEQQLEVCSTAVAIPTSSWAVDLDPLCLIYGAGLFFCDPALAWVCRPATAPPIANEYDAVTLDTTEDSRLRLKFETFWNSLYNIID